MAIDVVIAAIVAGFLTVVSVVMVFFAFGLRDPRLDNETLGREIDPDDAHAADAG